MPEFPGLKDITAGQQDGLDYLCMIRGDVIVQINRDASTGALVWIDPEGCAVIDTDGNFLDPANPPEESFVTLAHKDYIGPLRIARDTNARNN